MALPNIFNLFQTPASPNSALTNPAVPSSASPRPDGTGPTALPAAGEGEKSPLSNFEKLWENDPNAPADLKPAPMFENNPQKLLDAAKTIDFAKSMPAEVVAKVVAGGSDAAAAFNTAINVVAQQAYAQSAHATTRIVEAALVKQREQLLAELPSMVRQHSVSDALRADNPLFSNPATAPMLKMFEERLSKMNPTATADQLKQMSRQYLTEFAQVVTETNKAAAPTTANSNMNMRKTGAAGEDWGTFFGQPS